MKSKVFLYPIVAALATVTAGVADASLNDIGDIPIIIKKKPDGAHIATATTDDYGKFTFANLREGEYAVAFPPPNRTAKNFH